MFHPKKLIVISCACFFYFCFINNALALENEDKSNAKIDLILAGGGLSTCSSFSRKNCKGESFSSTALEQLLYQFNQKSWRRFKASTFFSNLNNADKLNLNSIIDVLVNDSENKFLTKQQIRKLLKSSPVFNTYQTISDASYYALFDFFEAKQLDARGQRKRETVILAKSKKVGTRAVFNAFVQQAELRAKEKGKSLPTLLAVTASSRDPFESADFYEGVLSNFNAKVNWLPLDRSLQQAISDNQCQKLDAIRNEHLLFDRSRIYPERSQFQKQLCKQPEKLLEIVASADGIFFNGGDQSKTIQALTTSTGQPSEVLKLIQNQVAAGKLVVAGTSAGTAVQAGGQFEGKSIPMLTNGDPENALKRGAFAANAPSVRCDEQKSCGQEQIQPGDLTYRVQGGSGLFSLGLLDTHFSERDREVRLSAFATASQTRFAFGVDETTAMTVKRTKDGGYSLGVIGDNGVFVLEQPLTETVPQGPIAHVAGLSFFLNEGDNLIYDPAKGVLAVSFAGSSNILSKAKRAKQPLKLDGTWRAQVANKCGTNGTIKWRHFDYDFLVKRSAETQFAKNTKGQCSYAHLPFVIRQSD